jgi:2-polyprenyl-3-methyl-5-hydroxy-6-metoxy-1,4-benzoquinol methylase
MRGGQPQWEVEHGRLLAERGAERIWGWNTPAGRVRVKRRVRWLTSACALAPGVRALECGCGTGVFTRELARTGAEIVAADISPELLAEARRLCPSDNVRCVETNLEDPSNLEDGSFDAIYGVSVLHHLDLARALPRLAAKLRPGGRFAFSEPNLWNPLNKWVIFSDNPERRERLGVSPGEMAFRPHELRGAMEAAGLHVDALTHRDFLYPGTPRAMIPLISAGGSIAERVPLVRRISGSLWICGSRPGSSADKSPELGSGSRS